MNQYFEQALLVWSWDYKNAHTNTRLMLDNVPNHEKICTKNMVRLDVSEQTLMSFSNELELPEEYKRWVKSEKLMKTNNCCSFESNPNKIHPDCKLRFKEYFDSQKALLEYIEKIEKNITV